VPFADVGPLKVPDELPDEKVLFLSDIFPTAWMAAENANIQPGDTVAIWGAGPVGLLAVRCAFLLGAERVISIDCYENRLRIAREAGAETLNFNDVEVYEAVVEMTGGRGPDGSIDAVGLEAYGHTFDALYDRAKAALFMTTDRAHALRQAIQCCRKGGTVSMPGVYGGLPDKLPLGAAFAKGLTFKMGQTHMHRYMKPLLGRIQKGEIDPSFIISHRLRLDDGPDGYANFKGRQNEVIKIVMKP
jgi:threonine dehydrogenase-like Zn-dependent dehydrogenase